jgi:hypothetical protein
VWSWGDGDYGKLGRGRYTKFIQIHLYWRLNVSLLTLVLREGKGISIIHASIAIQTK